MTEKLDPDIEAILERRKQALASVADPWNVDTQRRMFAATVTSNAQEPPPMRRVQDLTIPGPAGDIPARLFEAESVAASPAPPLMVYFHGGGWVLGSIDSHDIFARVLSGAFGAVLLSVDYRLAPEHRFPAAVDDAWAATQWAAANAATLGADPTRFVVAGDSAGGNLAASVCLLARDAGAPSIAAQMLLYPAVDFTMEAGSRTELAEGFGLTKQALDWFAGQYLNDPAEARDPRASPLLADDHSNLPPALVVVGQFDPLRDESEAYANKLQAAGVRVTYACRPGMTHGFLQMGGAVRRVGPALEETAAALRALMG